MQFEGQKVRLDATRSDLSGSRFDDVNISGCDFENVNMSGWRVHNANIAGLKIANANLAGASIIDARLEGMTIDGISVIEMLEFWRAGHSALAETRGS
jgi:uncharacterized protein YjbI with pentapeptide repeats